MIGAISQTLPEESLFFSSPENQYQTAELKPILVLLQNCFLGWVSIHCVLQTQTRISPTVKSKHCFQQYVFHYSKSKIGKYKTTGEQHQLRAWNNHWGSRTPVCVHGSWWSQEAGGISRHWGGGLMPLNGCVACGQPELDVG